MEGTVAVLDEERAVKLWDFRDRTDIDRLRVFYDAVAESGFALAVPRILEVAEVEGRMVTVQVRLHGEPLADADAVVDVLAALADVPVHPDMAVLPVPDGERPFDPTVPFARSLADLVERRAALLAGHVGAHTVAALADDLRHLAPREPRLVHGDLGPGNVLAVDGRPTALLDFGYVSTVGDPAFDAAVAAAVADMFGPRLRRDDGADRRAHPGPVRLRGAAVGALPRGVRAGHGQPAGRGVRPARTSAGAWTGSPGSSAAPRPSAGRRR